MLTTALTGPLGTVLDLMLVVLGFSLIIFIHELGHFLAARWAGIRVLAFAIGFGGALVSFRKGLGLRFGSSELDYRQRLAARGATLDGPIPAGMDGISPTEYRINWLPLGGYVKMLGQEDDNPNATSEANDSYQRCKPWKRMIVISAGVVMNVILAAVLFVIVFSAGLKTEAAVVGGVGIGSPAARAGLQAGDEIVSINGREPDSFKDVAISVAMSASGEPLRVAVRRPGEGAAGKLIEVDVIPEPDAQSKLLSIGIASGSTGELSAPTTAAQAVALAAAYKRDGLEGIKPGGTLVSAPTGGEPVGPWWLDRAAKASNGAPFPAWFRGTDGVVASTQLKPLPEMQTAMVRLSKDLIVPFDHVLGIVPVMTVREVAEGGRAAGLQAGDIFAQIGSIEYPSLPDGIAEIRSNSGRTIAIAVERAGKVIDLGAVKVSSDGTIGFAPETTARSAARVSRWPSRASTAPSGDKPASEPSFAALGVPRGSTITKVGGAAVASLGEIREAIRTGIARAGGEDPAVELAVEYIPPVAGAAARVVAWSPTAAERAELQALSWLSPVSLGLFEPDMKLLRGDSLGGALALGFRETHRVMVQTYLTFARLFQGSVKVEHLKGPVGIAHVGTLIADRGMVWLLFFMAVISVNLAVINFLPLPIVDGGHFLFLLYEQITGRPVSVRVQNIATIAGLAMIGTVFLIVTYNDIARLITGG